MCLLGTVNVGLKRSHCLVFSLAWPEPKEVDCVQCV